jgi:DNA-binding transcriptional LysR family regulator
MISLRQLEIFLAIAECGSTTRAADQVMLSQSAISNALAELESRLGVQLFDRVGKRLVLNDAGRRLQPRARLLMAQAHELDGLFVDTRGRLAIGASTTIGNYLLPRLLGRAGVEHPCSRVEIANTEVIAGQVARCELDVGLVEGLTRQPELELSHWRDDEMVVVAAAASHWARAQTGLERMPWIMREQGSGTRSVVEGEFPELSAAAVRLELGSSEAIHHAVLAGLGISCLSRQVVERSLHTGELVQLVPERSIRRPLYILRHRQRPDTAAIRALMQLLGVSETKKACI